ncbi:hypothetical protein N9B72_00885 [Bacteriovoracaceae bacterium]|nr:hypothetical protein [Bacteriovoracaceae bacterium]
MKHCIVTTNSNLYFSKRLLSIAELNGQSLIHIDPLNATLNELGLQNIDGVCFHRVGSSSLDNFDIFLSSPHKVVINHQDSLLKYRNKIASYLALAKANIKVLPFMGVRGVPKDDYLQSFFNDCQKFSDQFVIKPEVGMKGIGVNHLESKNKLFSWIETLKYINDQKFIIQPYASNAQEYRLFLSKFTEPLLFVKNNEGKFKSNAHQGGGLEYLKLDSRFEYLFDLPGQLKLDYLALDVINFNEKLYVLDLNPVCGFEGLESASGVDILSQLFEYGLKRI